MNFKFRQDLITFFTNEKTHKQKQRKRRRIDNAEREK
jgi:hypothetical protein